MNRALLALAAIASSFFLGTWAAAEPPTAPPPAPSDKAAPAPSAVPIPLDRAVAAGLVSVKGLHPAVYRSVELHLTSTSAEAITVDLAGRYLKPKSGRCQRLGLSFPQGGVVVMADPAAKPSTVPGGGVFALTLLPGETKVLRMNSCCMDAGRSCPADSDEFDLAGEPPPKNVETALRWWVDHPTAPQGFVNAAIWQSKPRLLERPWAPDPTTPSDEVVAPPKGRAITAYGGVAYLLTDGDLIRVDAEGVHSFVGSLVYQAIPLADGLVGVGLGESGREVWRFAQTGEPPWTKKFDLERDGSSWPDVIPAAGGAHILIESSRVALRSADGTVTHLVSRGSGATIDVAPTDAARSHFVVVLDEKGRQRIESQVGGAGIPGSSHKVHVYDIEIAPGQGGSATLRKTYWNVGDMAAGPGGIFALSHVGLLERLEGERLVQLVTVAHFDRILAVGVARILLADASGAVFSVDGKTGRVTPLPGLPAQHDRRTSDERTTLTIDPVTDDVLWVDDDGFHRLKREAKDPETLR